MFFSTSPGWPHPQHHHPRLDLALPNGSVGLVNCGGFLAASILMRAGLGLAGGSVRLGKGLMFGAGLGVRLL